MLTARCSNGYRPPCQFLFVDNPELKHLHQLASDRLRCGTFRAYAEVHAPTRKRALQKLDVFI